jgi:RimJ/RimL family protein N-acetyltransferase
MIEGSRVRLRAPEARDAEAMIKIFHDQDVMKRFTRDMFAPVSLTALTQDLNNLWKEFGKDFYFSIEEKSKSRYIGSCGYNKIDRKNSYADIGIYLERSYWSQGLGTEALKLLISYLFDQNNLNKIRLNVHANNESAIRCYERLGFQHEGRLREELFQDGHYQDICLMGLLRCEWHSKK